MMKGLITICSECGVKTELREISIEFERKGVRATMSGIPAMVCPNCGEEYVPSGIASTVVDAVSRTIDGTVDLLKQTRMLRRQLVPEGKIAMRECLDLALA
ncbi:MAG: YgiT-type zinc finger protein [Chloroflexi bacterium]|nr:YgiT-type zinc finger protein [Chloroflexota bacterium]